MYKPNFTDEQKYWLCDKIGEWYFEWKTKMTDGTPHRLGFAKEILKSLLCDDILSPEDESARKFLLWALPLKED